ncbi:MAG: hypothetical protein IAF58_09900 [Leptolyngbya sp.]|nr:hypothetical protein [Candidatus Melainabacteria bacterium]
MIKMKLLPKSGGKIQYWMAGFIAAFALYAIQFVLDSGLSSYIPHWLYADWVLITPHSAVFMPFLFLIALGALMPLLITGFKAVFLDRSTEINYAPGILLALFSIEALSLYVGPAFFNGKFVWFFPVGGVALLAVLFRLPIVRKYMKRPIRNSHGSYCKTVPPKF